jgi:hypothetical protein
MKPEIKTRWIAKLLSGEFQQGRGTLRSSDNKFCCLGVLCELAVENGIIPKPTLNESSSQFEYGASFATGLPPYEVVIWAQLGERNPSTKSTGHSFAFQNDHGSSFADIAKMIEETL